MCEALKEIAAKRDDVMIVYPVHPNPNVQKTVYSVLSGAKNIFLTPPMAYKPFAFLMGKAHFILTDSGGIQEAAPSLNKPVLVMREKTERTEGVEIGSSKLVGTSKEKIVEAVFELLDNPKTYDSMIGKINPFGDGHAAERIAEILDRS
ncbi:MAG: UDP-N-acetylglucosamine 2-epimerase [Candidatus Jorgensenbacteria bacterium]